ncbi:MAG TPA: TonB-dependent receptor [Opitutus sp.]|nr:TonB-dependent receptor [Opitutus sp.]
MNVTTLVPRAPAFAFGLLATTLLLSAQTAPAPSSAAPADELITLDEFTVTSDQASGYRATSAITATGIGTKIADTPLAISVVTGELMQDTAALEMREALNLVPGVLTNPRGESTVVIRGFSGLISYRNGQYRRQLMTTWNMDRIEVIKGPSAIFFGAVRPGGIVNNVTIKPVLTDTFTDVKVTGGSDAFVQGEVFHNQVVNDKLAFRVGVGGIDRNGTRAYEYLNEGYAGLSALWKPTENQQLTLDLEILERQLFYLSSYPARALANSKVLGQPGAVAAQAGLDRQAVTADTANRNYLTSLGYSGTFGAPNFYPLFDMFAPYGYETVIAHDATQWQASKTVDLDYLLKIGERLVFQSTWNYAWDDTDGLQPSSGETRPYADGSVRFRVEEFINIRDSYNVHNKFTYRFELGPTKHTVQAGQEFQRVIFTRPGYLNAANQYNDSPGNTGSTATNPYRTFFYPGGSAPVSLRDQITASGQTFNITRKSWDDSEGYFIVDQSSFFNDRLMVLAGARYNDFGGKRKYSKPVSNSSLSATAPGGLIDYDRVEAKGGWTPQYGVMAKLIPQVGLFATYSESIEAIFGLDADGNGLEPVESQSLDLGVKTELFNGRLTSTLAYYDIDRQNLSYRDTTRELATGRAPYYIFGNSEASSGIELDVNWAPFDNYTLIAGWSHVTEAETTKSNNATFVGRRFGGIPENTYVLWNRYTFTHDALQNLTVGFGVRHNDGTNLSPDPQIAVWLPSFTVYDAMLSYKFKVGNRDLRAQLNVKNLTNEKYREGGDGFFGQARTWTLSLATRF